VKIWEVASGRLLHTLSVHSSVYSVAFSPDGRLLASGSDDKTVKIWEVASGRLLRTRSGHSSYVKSVAFSPDGRLLVSEAGDGTIVWDVASGTPAKLSPAQVTAVRSDTTMDGRLKANISGKQIAIVDVPSARLLHTLSGHNKYVYSVAFSPDGRLLASEARDGTIVWDVASGSRANLAPDKVRILRPDITPDGRLKANIINEEQIAVFDVPSGRLLHTLSGHSSTVYSVAFSPDGRLLASGSDDNVKIWEVASGRLLHTLSGHGDRVRSVAFSPDGRLLASGSDDRTVKIWGPA
jgi:WD40 repeat protein